MTQNIFKSKNTFLFDFDGTLVDTTPAIHAAANIALEYFGQPIVTEATINTLTGRPLSEFFKRLSPNIESAEILQYYRDKYLEIAQNYIKLYPGAIEMLVELKARGNKLAIVSTKNKLALFNHLEYFDMVKFFQEFYYFEAVKTPKPDPEGINLAIEALNSTPAKSIMIGDSSSDLGAARNAGVESVLVSWTGHDKQALVKEFDPILIESLSLLVQA